MLNKKMKVDCCCLNFSRNKFVGINDKIRELVEKNDDINRAAFYAYGAYLNHYRNHLLKRIFKTENIDVQLLALAYGFTTAPRVKEGKFVKHLKSEQKMKAKAKEN